MNKTKSFIKSYKNFVNYYYPNITILNRKFVWNEMCDKTDNPISIRYWNDNDYLKAIQYMTLKINDSINDKLKNDINDNNI